VAEILGHPVVRLIRVRIGPIDLGELKAGQWRQLTEQELKELSKPKRYDTFTRHSRRKTAGKRSKASRKEKLR
jgi:hypothetical protein